MGENGMKAKREECNVPGGLEIEEVGIQRRQLKKVSGLGIGRPEMKGEGEGVGWESRWVAAPQI